MFRASLKAGIIMGIVGIVVILLPLTALEIRPEALSDVAVMAEMLLVLLMNPVLWFASGILAARFGAAAALTTGAAAGAGALAGAIAQIIGLIATGVTNFIFFATPLHLPPIDFAAVTIAIAAGLGALGGIVGRAISARRGS